MMFGLCVITLINFIRYSHEVRRGSEGVCCNAETLAEDGHTPLCILHFLKSRQNMKQTNKKTQYWPTFSGVVHTGTGLLFSLLGDQSYPVHSEVYKLCTTPPVSFLYSISAQ